MNLEAQEIRVSPEFAGKRLDHFLVAQFPDFSRARVQQLIQQGKVLVNAKAGKPSSKLAGTDVISITGSLYEEPLRAIPEDIPLSVVYEDQDLAVVDKPAGMMVHAGAGATEDQRNRGTLVNALLHRFRALSQVGGELRPGIVHRLDRNTSGLIVVAKNDIAHRRLAAQFSGREISKQYVALVHGWLKQPTGTISAAISRDQSRRTRMTVRGHSGRAAVSHYAAVSKFESPYGKFSVVEVNIETGRTHQIRVHLASIGHPVVGDTLYGAPAVIRVPKGELSISLPRHFLHAAKLQFRQPTSGKELSFASKLPEELQQFLRALQGRDASKGE
jgi:23S rRNA pseudouridine1911/1915/1917 synthase